MTKVVNVIFQGSAATPTASGELIIRPHVANFFQYVSAKNYEYLLTHVSVIGKDKVSLFWETVLFVCLPQMETLAVYEVRINRNKPAL